ncbi:electron transport complex subunit RsxG [Litorivicinus lipolyticus]|uniref:Ion-translocating oxidoreductase complex subunit G n=1 Tax=Litorivicinus lipolyticus TaxID=418701 RepID=A0A5Q2QA09_9GAMM|nr:electron transport complex subunit RsxG [Litorivicinus lipolyticus]QGG79804.1 electron transport complex subunit RsxG [Litorivicinus lipolyticus]
MILALMSRGAISLSLFGLVTAGAVALTQVATDERIEYNQAEVARAALRAVLPAHNNEILADARVLAAVPALGAPDALTVSVGRLDDRLTGYAIPVVTTQGYSGPIAMVIGITPDGTVSGVRVTQHRETPGLGDKIDLAKSPWVRDFDGTHLNNRNWAVRPDGGDFDAFTGATITPRAVVAAVERALQWYQDRGRALLEATPNG